MELEYPVLWPRLVVRDVKAAVAFYSRVFDAQEIDRYTAEDGSIPHLAMRIGDAIFGLTQEDLSCSNVGAEHLGGSPVILSVTVPDPDSTQAAALQNGATVIFEVADQFYGRREGRFSDPFGHLWMIGKAS